MRQNTTQSSNKLYIQLNFTVYDEQNTLIIQKLSFVKQTFSSIKRLIQIETESK